MAESLITPDGPTVLSAVSVLTLDHLDVFGYLAGNSYIIPEIIDVERFHSALAKTLTVFPLYAARASCAEDGREPWALVLPPRGIPVTASVSDETQIVRVEAVVQEPLRFVPELNPRKVVRDPTTPVAAILLTKFPNLGVTSIGITRWHPIGSDFVASCFIRTLSKLYIGVPDNEPAPVYKAVRAYLPAPNKTCLEGIDTYAVEAYYSARVWHPQVDPSQPGPANVRLNFRLSAAQTQQLRDAVHALGGENASFLSAQDCIVSLITIATNAADLSNPPIHSIDTILDVRGAGDIPATLAFNGFVFAPTDKVVAAHADDYYAYALAVRHSIIRGRTPSFLAALADLQAARAAEGTNRGEIMDLASPPGRMLCNSTLRLDKAMRPDIHFGHPDKIKSYVATVPFVRHLKLARPNPHMKADGAWSSGLEDTEVTLYFQPLVRARFIEEINKRLRVLKVEGAAEWTGL
ncbi:hypothetical protein B0H16DRAFT_1574718 [Mycena metata]|uniref:Uncharacterized protein n=1 Tax=Mycena metata TaxID=1033252 RepID=A0AAD7MX00_9AGAR|nr:hypothetical protein B0H16DRAFT_1574718 [Mycena metata]